jgi:hypothetical protein
MPEIVCVVVVVVVEADPPPPPPHAESTAATIKAVALLKTLLIESPLSWKNIHIIFLAYRCMYTNLTWFSLQEGIMLALSFKRTCPSDLSNPTQTDFPCPYNTAQAKPQKAV